ncbi:MAG: type II CRISPR-associated endonuclease Cas1 [Victivallaceae bacterium]|nr:type II CRISPR-associated endonuclease Cas1 [Victivallaceae bacterium]
MIDRIINLESGNFFLHAENKLLVIEDRRTKEKHTIPFKDIGVLVCGTSQITLTESVISQIAENGGIAIFMNKKHLANAMTLPLSGHHLQSERMAAQARISEGMKKRVWKNIIKTKIFNQARVLELLNNDDAGLRKMGDKVLPGDKNNTEARAATAYFKALGVFSRRDKDAEDNNILFNYAYSVLHATATRALCAAGLHPTLGINHHNRYNPFCLASDLMEPLRPLLDYAIVETVRKNGGVNALDKEMKARILKPFVSGRVYIDKKSCEIFFALNRMASSYAAVCQGVREEIVCPLLIPIRSHS